MDEWMSFMGEVFFIGGGARFGFPVLRGVFQRGNLLGFLEREPPLRIGAALASRAVDGNMLCVRSYSYSQRHRAFTSEEWIGA